MLRKILAFVQSIDKEQVTDFIQLVNELVALFSGRSSADPRTVNAASATAPLSGDAQLLVEELKARGCDEEDCKHLVATIAEKEAA